MILAAPLVIPFAEAVGISIATLGMAKGADMVNDYIQENPEESAMILKTLVPNLGIGEIFMKKGKDEEVEEEVSVEDIDPKDLTKEEKAKMMKELAKSGASREKMIKGYEEIIQPGEDRTLVDAEERYDEGGVEDAPKPKFDYKKFFRKRRADGGAIGIEVLFEEKKPRKNFNTGGTTYDPRASAVDYATALNKVGAGTQAQKRQSLSDYLGNVISTQAQKIGNAAVIPLQAAKGVLGIQGTPITDSMQTSLQNIIQKQIKDSGKLSGNINYKDYGVKTNTQGNEFLGFGDRSFTDPEAALATTLGQASYSVDPKTGKITFTGGTAYDFGDDQFGGLGKFISKGGAFNQLPSASNKFQPGATEYNPDITLGSDFMKQFNQPKYPDYKTAALQSQYYKNNPSSLDSDLFRAAYARAVPDSGIKTRITKEGQVYTDYGNYDPSRVYSAYMSNRGTSSSNPFFDQFKGSQYAEMPAIMKAMYGDPGNLNPYYADGGRVGLFMGGPALEGQALNIYNSMNSYGFSDQEIANTLQGQGLYTPPGSDAEPPTTIQPIGFQGGGGDGRVTELQETFTKDLSQDPRFDYLEPTAQANKYRFDRSVEPRDGLMGLVDKTKNFFAENKFFQPKVRGTLGTRLSNQPRLPLPLSVAAYARSPFNPESPTYNANIADQLNFLELGENLIGRDPGTGGLKYGSGSVLSGKNVISGFGTNNYDTALRNFISKMKANTRISAERKAARLAAAEKELLDLQTKSKKGLGRDVDRGGFDPSGPTQRSIREEREDRSGRGQSGGFTNPGKGSYGPFMADGGLATMFTRRR